MSWPRGPSVRLVGPWSLVWRVACRVAGVPHVPIFVVDGSSVWSGSVGWSTERVGVRGGFYEHKNQHIFFCVSETRLTRHSHVTQTSESDTPLSPLTTHVRALIRFVTRRLVDGSAGEIYRRYRSTIYDMDKYIVSRKIHAIFKAVMLFIHVSTLNTQDSKPNSQSHVISIWSCLHPLSGRARSAQTRGRERPRARRPLRSI